MPDSAKHGSCTFMPWTLMASAILHGLLVSLQIALVTKAYESYSGSNHSYALTYRNSERQGVVSKVLDPIFRGRKTFRPKDGSCSALQAIGDLLQRLPLPSSSAAFSVQMRCVRTPRSPQLAEILRDREWIFRTLARMGSGTPFFTITPATVVTNQPRWERLLIASRRRGASSRSGFHPVKQKFSFHLQAAGQHRDGGEAGKASVPLAHPPVRSTK
ncbi:unnamed protein product [Chrysoparadoxa australica]